MHYIHYTEFTLQHSYIALHCFALHCVALRCITYIQTDRRTEVCMYIYTYKYPYSMQMLDSTFVDVCTWVFLPTRSPDFFFAEVWWHLPVVAITLSALAVAVHLLFRCLRSRRGDCCWFPACWRSREGCHDHVDWQRFGTDMLRVASLIHILSFLRDLDGYGANAQLNFAKGDSMLCVVRNCLTRLLKKARAQKSSLSGDGGSGKARFRGWDRTAPMVNHNRWCLVKLLKFELDQWLQG